MLGGKKKKAKQAKEVRAFKAGKPVNAKAAERYAQQQEGRHAGRRSDRARRAAKRG